MNDREVPWAGVGDNVDVVLGGIDESALRSGYMLCWPSHPVAHVSKFKARVAVLPGVELPLVPGQQFTLHSHVAEEPCNVTRFLRTVDREGHTRDIKPRTLAAGDVAIVRIRTARPVCLDAFADHRRLGRFILRYGGVTVAAGMVLKLKVAATGGR